MTRGAAHVPHCLGCNRPQDETPGMFLLKQGGMASAICWDCVDELHARAWLIRLAAVGAVPNGHAAVDQ